MKKNSSLKVLSVIGVSLIPLAIAPLIVSCSKQEEEYKKFYDEANEIEFDIYGNLLKYSGTNKIVDIPEYLIDSKTGRQIKIVNISSRSFENTSLTQVTMSDSIVEIGIMLLQTLH